MRAYLINPEDRTVEQVDYDGNYKSIYTFIGADTFDVVGMEKGDGIYVDDEGLLKGPALFFHVRGMDTPLAGKGLVLGTDNDGESVEPKILLETLRQRVRWATPVKVNKRVIWIMVPVGETA